MLMLQKMTYMIG